MRRDLFKNLVDAVEKTHVEHLVGFIQDNCPYFRKFCGPSSDKVDKASGSGNDDVNTPFQLPYLAVN